MNNNSKKNEQNDSPAAKAAFIRTIAQDQLNRTNSRITIALYQYPALHADCTEHKKRTTEPEEAVSLYKASVSEPQMTVTLITSHDSVGEGFGGEVCNETAAYTERNLKGKKEEINS